jgi:hypothetical protein
MSTLLSFQKGKGSTRIKMLDYAFTAKKIGVHGSKIVLEKFEEQC